MSIMIEQTHYEPIPTGKYPAKITSIEETDGMYGPQLRINFEVMVDNEPRTLYGWCSMKFNHKSKLYEWTQAAVFNGAPIPREYKWSSDDMVNRKVYLTAIEKQGEKGLYNTISALSPYVKPVSQVTPPQPALTTDEESDW